MAIRLKNQNQSAMLVKENSYRVASYISKKQIIYVVIQPRVIDYLIEKIS